MLRKDFPSYFKVYHEDASLGSFTLEYEANTLIDEGLSGAADIHTLKRVLRPQFGFS